MYGCDPVVLQKRVYYKNIASVTHIILKWHQQK